MAKTTKGGRIMNPTDAARKQARKKEIARNKLERDMQRATPKEVPEISKRLGELLEEEEAAKAGGKPISRQLHIKRKVLQDAMKLAVAKEREDGAKSKGGDGASTAPHGHGVARRQPEDSVYYDAIHNPSGAPPPGRPQRYRGDVDALDPAKADEADAARAAAADAERARGDAGPTPVLPPPDEPPPGILPPPGSLPPGVLPPPSGPPPGFGPGGPPMPPPGWIPPPPAGPPPGFDPAAAAPIVEGAATAQRTIPAHHDVRLTSMVPANVRAKRQKAPRAAAASKLPVISANDANAGFGLAPQVGGVVTGAGSGPTDASVASFLDELAQL